jgi:hypothetical protein
MSFRAGRRYTRMDYKLELVLIPVTTTFNADLFPAFGLQLKL